MSKILFNGLLIAGEIKIVIPSITVYGGNEMGCSEAVFNATLAAAGYFYDSSDECFYHNADDGMETRITGANIRLGNDWVWFEGTPLQYIGIDDKAGKKIFDGDYCKCDDGFDGIIEYEQQGACFVLRNRVKARYKPFDGGGQYGDADGIQQQNMETLGNMTMYVNRECAVCGRKVNHCVCS